jgi:PEGA domain
MRFQHSVICLLFILLVLAGGAIVTGDTPLPTGDNIGYYRVLSNAEGAMVYLDTAYKGQILNGELGIPVDVNTMSYRTYTVRTQSGELFHGYILESPRPGRTVMLFATINPAATEKPGVLTIISDPSGASVFINGKPAGKVPVSGVLQFIKYSPGDYAIELRLPGYQTYQEGVIVRPDTETTVNAILHQNLTGTLKFISFPGGGSVFLDGSYLGITPLEEGNITYGAHEVLIRLNGYEDWTGPALVKPDVITPVTVRLFPINITTGIPTPSRTKLVFPVFGLFISLIITCIFVKYRRK